MHRPPDRRDPLRRRVSQGRVRREARQRRVYATIRVTKRSIAVIAAVLMVGAFATVTQVASAEPDPAAEFLGVGNECAISTSDLELHVEEEVAGVTHYHYRGHGKHWWGKHHRHKGHKPPAGPGDQPSTPPSAGDDCDESGATPEPTGEPSTEPTGEPGPGPEPTGEPGTEPGGPSTEPAQPSDPAEPGTEPGEPNEPPVDEPPSVEEPDLLGTSCEQSDLPEHDGFQDGARCVTIEMGEVSEASLNPSLLITAAPTTVARDEPFIIQVSTRNLVRDRFLPAGQGGYYRESSYLTDEGITRGHFHIGCRLLPDPNVAEVPDADPAFFVAIEDFGGGLEPDFVDVEIPGLAEPGLYRCMAWAGDPTHRVPMMQFARHFVAVDVVRIIVE